jgi:hypothetical protein
MQCYCYIDASIYFKSEVSMDTTKKLTASEASKQSRLRRIARQKKALEQLEKELKRLNANKDIIALLDNFRTGSQSRSNSMSYMTRIFGTEEPAIGTKVSFLEAGLKGKNGERMNAGESMADFIARVKDIDSITDANTLQNWVWSLNKKHDIEFNRNESYIKVNALNCKDN